MLRNAKALKGFKLGALDGEIGRVKDFYFDDEKWTVRYVVADTGNQCLPKSSRSTTISRGADFQSTLFGTQIRATGNDSHAGRIAPEGRNIYRNVRRKEKAPSGATSMPP